MKNEPHAKMRLLLVDDSDLVRSAMQRLLTGRGCEVFSYADPTLCPLHQAEHCRCPNEEVCADVLVTDLDMPNLGGLEFIRELLRKDCKIRNVAILSGSPVSLARARAAGLHCQIFTKPEGVADLIDWLDTVEASLPLDRRLSACLTG